MKIDGIKWNVMEFDEINWINWSEWHVKASETMNEMKRERSRAVRPP